MSSQIDPDEVAYAGVIGQRTLLEQGRLSAVELLELCERRIDRLDPLLGAFAARFPERARAEAEQADAARAAGDARPLLGVPVAIKDNVRVAGHAPRHGTGSPEPVAERDAEQVRLLRDAGAIVIGTTRLPELALWPFTESQTGGTTRNPWSLGHTPGGSSGGSAAAVAAGLVSMASASDGGGSIRLPAACCGLVGLKAGRDVVPLAPDLDHWHGLSSAGALTRTVADAALVLDVLTSGRLGLADPLPEHPLRIAWTTKGMQPVRLAAPVRAAVESTAHTLAGLGHEVVHADPSYDGFSESFSVRWARGAYDDWAKLADPSATEPRTRTVAAAGRRIPAAAVKRARRLGEEAARRMIPLPADADVLLMPVMPRPPARVGALRGRRALLRSGLVVPFTAPWNVVGWPAMSVPAGHTEDGLPLAVQLVAPPGGEARLLGVAAQLERELRWPEQRPPLG